MMGLWDEGVDCIMLHLSLLGMEIMPKLVSQSYWVEAPISALFLPPHGNKGSACTVHGPHDQIELGSTNCSHTIWVPKCVISKSMWLISRSHFLHYSKSVPESVLFDQMTSFPSPYPSPKKTKNVMLEASGTSFPVSSTAPGYILHSSFFLRRPCIELGMRKFIPTYIHLDIMKL